MNGGQRYPLISLFLFAAAPSMPLFLLDLLELHARQKHLPIQCVSLQLTLSLSLPLFLSSLPLADHPASFAH
jgi:hypothetical protein